MGTLQAVTTVCLRGHPGPQCTGMDAGLRVGFEVASCDVAHTRKTPSAIGTIHPCRPSRHWVEAPAETIHLLYRVALLVASCVKRHSGTRVYVVIVVLVGSRSIGGRLLAPRVLHLHTTPRHKPPVPDTGGFLAIYKPIRAIPRQQRTAV